MKLAFIGTGNMGSAMARNLLRAGHRVVVYNRTRAHAEPLQQDGATLAESAAEAAGDVDGVITMLSDDAAVEHAAAGFLDTLAAGAPPHRHEHRQRGLLQIACRRARHARAILRRRAGVRATRGGRRR